MAVKRKIAEGIIDLVRSPFERTIGPDFDPRFDPRKKERERLESLTVGVSPRGLDVPEVSLQDFEGRPFVTSMSDRTAAGGMLTDVRGRSLESPVDLRGGQDFMFDENAGQVWASGRGPAGAILAAAKRIRRETGENPLFIPWRMAPTGGDFATMTGETMLSFARDNMNKKNKKALDKSLKEVIEGWPGIDSAQAFEAYRNASADARKLAMNSMDVGFRDKGGLSIGEARLAVSDASQLAAQEGGIQNVGTILSEADTTIGRATHPSYPYSVPGEGVGRIKEDVNVFQLLPEIVEQRGIPDPLNPRATDLRSMQMGAKTGRITPEILRNIFGGGAAAGVGTGLMAPEEAEAAPFGTLARMIGKKTRETFHGSPHFFDQVDMSRMGSGEGTQFEGAGFYSAGARETAEGYQRDLSGYYGANAAAEQRAYSDLFDLAEEYAGDRDPEDLVDDIMSAVANNDYSELPENLRAPAQEIAVRSQGAIYRTEIPAEDLLDWDAPLSEQPVFVRNAVMDTARAAKADAADPNAIDLDALSGMTGGDAYEMLRAVYGNDASAELNNRGVLGVQYLDAMSREAGEGTRNYVVFDEANVNVVERNDQPVSALPRGRSLMGAAGATGASSAVASPLDDPERAERRANLRAVQVASDTLERLRRERGAVMSPLQDTRMARFGDYLTENRPSEMDPVQRALQSLGLFQGLGEYLRTTGEGQRTTTMQDMNAALDVVPL